MTEVIAIPENPFRGVIFKNSQLDFSNSITNVLCLAPASEDPNACALCEFVITMLDRKLKDNRTEESIKEALEGVCQRLPKGVQKDCVRLVDAYSEEIIEMLLADLQPDEVCVALKMCNPKSSVEGKRISNTTFSRCSNTFSFAVAVVGEAPAGITVGDFLKKIKQEEPRKLASTNTPMCVMCEYAMSTLEKRLITNSTEVRLLLLLLKI